MRKTEQPIQFWVRTRPIIDIHPMHTSASPRQRLDNYISSLELITVDAKPSPMTSVT